MAGLDRWSPPLIHTLALVLVTLAGLVDQATRPALGGAVPYVLPVLLAGWRLGRGSAIFWATAATGVWLAVERSASLEAVPLAYWNALGLLALLLLVGVLASGLRSTLRLARALAGTDLLTRVLNGHTFRELVELERSRALRYNRPFTLAYLDVEGLGMLKATRSTRTMERALQLVARTVAENIRSMDSVARLDRGEFGILLPETGGEAATVALNKVRDRLEEVVMERGLPLRFSVGAVICVGAPGSVDRLIQRAESLMRRVKQAGGGDLAVEILDDSFGIEAILQRG